MPFLYAAALIISAFSAVYSAEAANEQASAARKQAGMQRLEALRQKRQADIKIAREYRAKASTMTAQSEGMFGGSSFTNRAVGAGTMAQNQMGDIGQWYQGTMRGINLEEDVAMQTAKWNQIGAISSFAGNAISIGSKMWTGPSIDNVNNGTDSADMPWFK
jgi:hypothetical protein